MDHELGDKKEIYQIFKKLQKTTDWALENTLIWQLSGLQCGHKKSKGSK